MTHPTLTTVPAEAEPRPTPPGSYGTCCSCWSPACAGRRPGLVTAGSPGTAWPGYAHPATTTTTSAEAGFARDISVPHAQAVQMSLIARDTLTDPHRST